MDWSNPIVYELGLTVAVALGFWIWQTLDLRRAARELQDEAQDGDEPAAPPGTPAERER